MSGHYVYRLLQGCEKTSRPALLKGLFNFTAVSRKSVFVLSSAVDPSSEMSKGSGKMMIWADCMSGIVVQLRDACNIVYLCAHSWR